MKSKLNEVRELRNTNINKALKLASKLKIGTEKIQKAQSVLSNPRFYNQIMSEQQQKKVIYLGVQQLMSL